MDEPTVGKRISAAVARGRAKLFWSIEELADATNISQDKVEIIEHDASWSEISDLEQIAEAFGVTFWDFMRDALEGVES